MEANLLNMLHDEVEQFSTHGRKTEEFISLNEMIRRKITFFQETTNLEKDFQKSQLNQLNKFAAVLTSKATCVDLIETSKTFRATEALIKEMKVKDIDGCRKFNSYYGTIKNLLKLFNEIDNVSNFEVNGDLLKFKVRIEQSEKSLLSIGKSIAKSPKKV